MWDAIKYGMSVIKYAIDNTGRAVRLIVIVAVLVGAAWLMRH
jgi:hypothetical protein